jgi:hypothetical protein
LAFNNIRKNHKTVNAHPFEWLYDQVDFIFGKCVKCRWAHYYADFEGIECVFCSRYENAQIPKIVLYNSLTGWKMKERYCNVGAPIDELNITQVGDILL